MILNTFDHKLLMENVNYEQRQSVFFYFFRFEHITITSIALQEVSKTGRKRQRIDCDYTELPPSKKIHEFSSMA